MSDNKNLTHFCAFEITEPGMALRQMVVAGGEAGRSFKIIFTRGAIGQGRPSPDTDIYFMTELVDSFVDVPIKENYAKSKNHIMVIVIDGLKLQNDLVMTEIGIFARLIDAVTGEEIMPELLYGYTFTYKYDYIPAGSSYNLYREIAFNTILSRDGKFEIVFDKTMVYITRKEFDDFLDGGTSWFDSTVSLVIEHNLNKSPFIQVLKIESGAGYCFAGETPAGGDNISVISRHKYIDSNTIQVFLPGSLSNPELLKVDEKTFIINTDTHSYEVSLL